MPHLEIGRYEFRNRSQDWNARVEITTKQSILNDLAKKMRSIVNFNRLSFVVSVK